MTVDTALLEADIAARREALDATRSFIVQAPAGSGKTELLIQRYLTLLGTVDNPEEVLAITFTRKAAAEMQLRVLQALERAQHGDEPEQAHEKTTWRAARAVLKRDAEEGWRVVANPRRLRIQTLDSLNASIARMQPMSAAGNTAGNVVGDDAALKRLYRQAAAATLDWLDEAGPLRAATEDVLLHVDTNTSIYIAYVARMLQTRDQWLPFVSRGGLDADESVALRIAFESSLKSVIERHLKKTLAMFPTEYEREFVALANYAGAQLRSARRDDNDITRLAYLDALPGTSPDEVGDWRAVVDLLLTKQCAFRKLVNKNQGFPRDDAGQKQAMHDLLDSLVTNSGLCENLHRIRSLPPATYTDEQWRVLVALFELLPLAVAELKRLFANYGTTDYIEIALSASRALGTADDPGDTALLLDYQLRHILVDEMQDTSKAQYRMLEALSGGWQQGDGRTLFCVGDPMQSIYRFRNAEVAQFLLAREKGIGSVPLVPLVLRRNFRSGEHLVDWFNNVFPDVLPGTDDPASSAVSYSPAVAVEAHAGRGATRVHPVFGADPVTEAEAGLAVIRDTLAANPGDDMAVLVRSRTHLSELLARLREAGIDYQSVDIDRLTDLPEIIDLLALTRAIAHPGDRLAWLAMLRAPWIGLDWSDLYTLVKGDRHAAVAELLHNHNRVAALSGYGRDKLREVRPLLDAMTVPEPFVSLRSRVESLWLRLGGAAAQTEPHVIENVYRYLDVLGKLEVCGTLHDVAELEAQLDIERVSSNSSARLQIMTMHRAKGLQFDHVMLFGLGRQPRSGDRDVLSWFDIPDEHGGEEKIISPVGRRDELENDPIHRFIELTEASKDRNEQGRLLYVACTRARKSLHLVGHTAVTRDGSDFRPAVKSSLLAMLWSALRSEFETAFAGFRTADEDDGHSDWLEPRLRRFRDSWRLPAVPAPPGQSTSTAGAVDAAVEFYWVGAESRIAGTIVHRWLQLVAEGRAGLSPGDLARQRPASERWLLEMGISGSSVGVILERVETALRGVLADARGNWLLNGDGHAELSLSGFVDGRIETGIIDRVRIDDDGTHWIVDYKTSSHEGGGLDVFLAAEADRYRAQLSRYAQLYSAWSGQAARCALYFPLLQAFVEVDVAPGQGL